MKKVKGKKRLIKFLAAVLVIVVVLTAVGPQLVLKAARQPEVEAEYSYSEYFYNSYEDIRSHLKDRVDQLKKDGITVEVSEYAVDKVLKLRWILSFISSPFSAISLNKAGTS